VDDLFPRLKDLRELALEILLLGCHALRANVSTFAVV
jgi:hypothetical protein